MKLENVDVAKLQLADLPKFKKCPCELCDDGCFDRAGNEHYPECTRQQPKRSKLPSVARCPLSHYKGSFLAATLQSGGTAHHRRQPCPPAPDNEIPTSFKNAPMSMISSQRDHYQPPPTMSKEKTVLSFKHSDNLMLPSSIPMEAKSHYQVEYIEKPLIPVSRRPFYDPVKNSQLNITEPTAPSASQTTTRAHFKSWNSAPTLPFAEMPAVAGHVLFPGTNRTFDTTTGSTFLSYSNTKQTAPAPHLDHSGNLKISGSMDLLTNYRQDYLTPELPIKKPNEVSNKDKSQEEKVYTRRPMNAISQTTHDYRPHSQHRPPPPANMEPFQSQINLGNSFSSVEKDSQYRVDYPGHDIKQHPRQPLAAPKDHQQPYMPPTLKMDNLTVTHRDFQPIDVSTLPRVRVIPLNASLTINDKTGPMETMSMSRHHYQSYEHPVSRTRYGEIAPNIYIPPLDKFQASTTNRETYQGRSGIPARPHVPEQENIRQGGAHDHNTNYRLDYHPHGLSLCAGKAYTIAKHKNTTKSPIPTQ